MDKYANQSVEFWNRRAQTFPRYDEQEASYANKVIAAIEESGISFSEKTVVDVGAGAGQFTLKLARKARVVTAIDLSDQMLAINQADAQRLGLTNIEYILKSFEEYEAKEKFDLAFCSMCPAVRDENSRRWLTNLAKEALIYIGFDKWVDSPPMAKLMARYEVERKVFNSGYEMESWLKDQGLRVTTLPLSGEWRQSFTASEALHWATTMLQDYGVANPEKAVVLEAFKPHWTEDLKRYFFKTPYFILILIALIP